MSYPDQVLKICTKEDNLQKVAASEESYLKPASLQAAQIQRQRSAKSPTVIETLRKYKTCQDWLRTIKSPATLKMYTSHLSALLRFLSAEQGKPINPDGFAKMREADRRALIFKYVLHLIDVAKKHAGKPVKGEISVNSIPTLLLGIKSWIDYNELPSPYWKKITKMLPKKVSNDFRAYKIEEIQKMYRIADPFDRLNILLFVAGGERVGGQEGLTFGNIIELKLPEGITMPDGWRMGFLDLYADSHEDRYIVPLSPEAMHEIDAAKRFREDQGETMTPDSPLIRDKFGLTERKGKRSKKINRPKAITSGGIRYRMKRLQILAGLPLNELQPDHSFRYFFDTALMNSDCKWEIKELMMGHKVGLDRYYYDKKSEKSRQKLIVEYMKAMDALTISPEYRLTKKISEYEEKLKGAAPKEMVADFIMREEALKKQIQQLKQDKDNYAKDLYESLRQEFLGELERRLGARKEGKW